MEVIIIAKKNIRILIVSFLALVIFVTLLLKYLGIQNSHTSYSAKSLGIKEIKSEKDQNHNGIDDYTDICKGAKLYISKNPKYKSKYYKNGYPNDGCGVCTDVIWNALQAAGYNLKSMVDKDIKSHLDEYTTIDKPDPNIDFRRVYNLKIFLQRNAEALTLSLKKPEEWQAGDIVVFTKHIAICSDKRNKDGIPFIIHHNGNGAREANDINHYTIVGHYRWAFGDNSSLILDCEKCKRI